MTRKYYRRFLFDTTLIALVASLIPAHVAFTNQTTDQKHPQETLTQSEEGYTLNFNNVPFSEVIKYVSDSTGINFMFEEQFVSFPVTIHSEIPLSRSSTLSLIAQIVRANNLRIVEDKNSVMITTSGAINQLPPITEGDNDKAIGPIATRFFSVKNHDPASVVAIIKPMLSKEALIDVADNSRSLIVTDITSNLEQIGHFLVSLDAKESPLEIQAYDATSMPSTELADLAREILTPFSVGLPLIVTPQIETNRVFIVSTPSVTDRAVQVMNDLDAPTGDRTSKHVSIGSTYIYKIKNRSHVELVEALEQVEEELSNKENPPKSLIDAIHSVKWIRSTNSLFFTATTPAATKIQEMLLSLDTPTDTSPVNGRTTFRIYKISNANEEQIRNSLKQMASDIKKWPEPDQDLVETINSMRWMKETNSLFFTGTTRSLSQLAQLLPVLDVTPEESHTPLSQLPVKSEFRIFYPKHQKGELLYNKIQSIASKLEGSNLADPAFLRTIKTLQWIPESNTFVATGDADSLKLMEETLNTLDIQDKGLPVEQTRIFSVHEINRAMLKDMLGKIKNGLNSENPSDLELINAIDSVQFINKKHFSATGTPSALAEIAGTLDAVDTEQTKKSSTMAVIKLQHAGAEALVDSLKKLEEDNDNQDSDLAEVLENAKAVEEINAIVVHGTPKGIDELKELISHYDAMDYSTQGGKCGSNEEFKAFSGVSPVLYAQLEGSQEHGRKLGLKNELMCVSLSYDKLTNTLYVSGSKSGVQKVAKVLDELQKGGSGKFSSGSNSYTFHLCKTKRQDFERKISNWIIEHRRSKGSKGSVGSSVSDVLKSGTWFGSSTVIFEGDPKTLEQVRAILAHEFPDEQSCMVGNSGQQFKDFAIYEIRSPVIDPQELVIELGKFIRTIQETGVNDPELFNSANKISIAPSERELIIPGRPEITQKIEGYLSKIDTGASGTQSLDTSAGIDFAVYKLQYQQGSDILTSLKQIGSEIAAAGGEHNASLISAINSLQWIAPTNSLVAIEKQEVVSKLKNLIKSLDRPLKQVFIEVLVIETTLSNSQNFGLEWASKGKFKDKFSWSTGNLLPPATTTSGAASVSGLKSPLEAIGSAGIQSASLALQDQFSLGVIGDIIFHKGKSFVTLGGLVTALQQDTDSTVVLNPKIITQDNQNSTIFVGQNVPFVGSAVNISGASQTSTTSVEYRDIGVNLSIKPMLGDDDIVTLDIVNDISEQAAVPSLAGASGNSTTGTVTGITTSHTSLNTRVHVPDQHFLVLSGMIRDTKTHEKSGVPCLGGLPVIGAAFSKNNRTNSKSNIIIFVRPHVIDPKDPKQHVKLTEQQEDRFKENITVPQMKEEFDAGLELLK